MRSVCCTQLANWMGEDKGLYSDDLYLQAFCVLVPGGGGSFFQRLWDSILPCFLCGGKGAVSVFFPLRCRMSLCDFVQDRIMQEHRVTGSCRRLAREICDFEWKGTTFGAPIRTLLSRLSGVRVLISVAAECGSFVNYSPVQTSKELEKVLPLAQRAAFPAENAESFIATVYVMDGGEAALMKYWCPSRHCSERDLFVLIQCRHHCVSNAMKQAITLPVATTDAIYRALLKTRNSRPVLRECLATWLQLHLVAGVPLGSGAVAGKEAGSREGSNTGCAKYESGGACPEGPSEKVKYRDFVGILLGKPGPGSDDRKLWDDIVESELRWDSGLLLAAPGASVATVESILRRVLVGVSEVSFGRFGQLQPRLGRFLLLKVWGLDSLVLYALANSTRTYWLASLGLDGGEMTALSVAAVAFLPAHKAEMRLLAGSDLAGAREARKPFGVSNNISLVCVPLVYDTNGSPHYKHLGYLFLTTSRISA